jgi:hypothetical protein
MPTPATGQNLAGHRGGRDLRLSVPAFSRTSRDGTRCSGCTGPVRSPTIVGHLDPVGPLSACPGPRASSGTWTRGQRRGRSRSLNPAAARSALKLSLSLALVASTDENATCGTRSPSGESPASELRDYLNADIPEED